MTITYQNVHDEVISELGYTSATVQADQTTRIIRAINDGLREFARLRPSYYNEECEYRPAALSSQPEGTYAAGAAAYDATITWAAGSANRLIGASVYSDDDSEWNVIRSVSGSGPYTCKLMLPSRFTDGVTLTIYERSVVPSDRKTISRVLETNGMWIDRTLGSGEILYIAPRSFFALPYLTDTTYSYPRYFTFDGSYVLLDNKWELDPSYSVWFKFQRSITLGSVVGTNIDGPDMLLEPLRHYALGSYLLWSGDSDGARHQNLALQQMRERKIVNA